MFIFLPPQQKLFSSYYHLNINSTTKIMFIRERKGQGLEGVIGGEACQVFVRWEIDSL